MTKQEQIKQYFSREDVKRCISIISIELEAGVPRRTLYYFIKGVKYRKVSDERAEKIIEVLNKLAFNPESTE